MALPDPGPANAGATGAALQATMGGVPGGSAAALGAVALPGPSAAALGAVTAQAGTTMPMIGAGSGAALLPTMPGAAGALGSAGAAGGAGAGDIAGAMAMLQQMMSAPPLSDAEFDDFVRRLERFGKVAESMSTGSPAAPTNTGGCSAWCAWPAGR